MSKDSRFEMRTMTKWLIKVEKFRKKWNFKSIAQIVHLAVDKFIAEYKG